jgi:signal peptidase I
MSAATTVSHVHFEPALGTERSNNPSLGIAENILKNGSACIAVQDGSMFPWFRSGDLVFVRRCGFEFVSAGDSILFEEHGKLKLHRVTRRIANHTAGAVGTLLLTKGDASNSHDALVCPDQFLARAIRIHRRNRHIDLESLGRKVIARIIARISAALPVVYRPLRAVKSMLFA